MNNKEYIREDNATLNWWKDDDGSVYIDVCPAGFGVVHTFRWSKAITKMESMFFKGIGRAIDESESLNSTDLKKKIKSAKYTRDMIEKQMGMLDEVGAGDTIGNLEDAQDNLLKMKRDSYMMLTGYIDELTKQLNR